MHAWETALLEHLLDVPFPGRDELRAQLSLSPRVKTIMLDGTLEFCDSLGPTAETAHVVPVEGAYETKDFVVQTLLFAGPHLNEVEIIILDLKRPRNNPVVSIPNVVLFRRAVGTGGVGAIQYIDPPLDPN